MWPTHYLAKNNRGGTPPAVFYLTTPPYPVETYEGLESAASFMFATPGIGDDDELAMQASFVSAVLTTFNFPTYEWEEELESSASFVSATVVTVGFILALAFDQLESAASFVSGVMESPLIDYDNWLLGVASEDLLSGGSFVSGVLT